jgi:hypothetical protein
MTDIDTVSGGLQAGQDRDTPLRGVPMSGCPDPMGMFIIGARMFGSQGSGQFAVWSSTTPASPNTPPTL